MRPKVRPVPYDLDEMERRVAAQGPTPGHLRSYAEWQYAADLAELALLLDAARQFGLVEGGPGVEVEAADRIIAQAARRGIEPAPTEELMGRFLRELMGLAPAEEAPPDNIVRPTAWARVAP